MHFFVHTNSYKKTKASNWTRLKFWLSDEGIITISSMAHTDKLVFISSILRAVVYQLTLPYYKYFYYLYYYYNLFLRISPIWFLAKTERIAIKRANCRHFKGLKLFDRIVIGILTRYSYSSNLRVLSLDYFSTTKRYAIYGNLISVPR